MTNNIERLIHIKQLFLRAEALSKKTDDISLIMLAQLLDFVVDSFLKLAIHTFPSPSIFAPPQKGYYNKISELQNKQYKSNMDFYRAWDDVIGRLRDTSNGLSITDLPLRRDMDRLHEIRNDVQHKGALPNPKDLQKYVPLVESFLRETYQQSFEVDFATLSGLALIQDPQIREQLQNAHEALQTDKWAEAVCQASIAFHLLLQLAEQQAHPDNLEHIGDNFDDVMYHDGRSIDFMSHGQRRGIGEILREIRRLREHLAVVGFGIDYGEYVAIKPSLPEVRRGWTDNGVWKDEYVTQVPRWYSDELNKVITKEYTGNEAERIVNFVEKQVLEIQASGGITL